MKRWMVMLLAIATMAMFAQAATNETPMPMRGMGMQGGMGMPGMKRQGNRPCNCPCGMGMMHPGMMGGMGMMGRGMMGGPGMMGMMGPGMTSMGGMGMMGDPEAQKEMMESMMEFQQQMMKQRLEFQQKMRRQMMSHPRVITNMLNGLLENPDALEKVLDANPDLKAKLKKVL
jgi:hypothetical protein